MNISLQIQDFGKLTALMNALGPSNRQRLNAVGAKALEVKVRSHVARISAGRHSSAGRLGASPTGHYRKGMRGIAGHATANGGEVVIPIAGISRAYHDITLTTPTSEGKQFLTIPKHAAAYGHTVPELKSRGWTFFRPPADGAKLISKKPRRFDKYKNCLMGSKNGEKPVIMFALAEAVHQRQDPSLLPSQAECAQVVSSAMTADINRRLSNAR